MAENAIKLEKGKKVIVGHTDVKHVDQEGDSGDYIAHLGNKECKVTQVDPSIVKDDLIVINSIDGAVHVETEKKTCSITSYSSAVVTKEMVRLVISSASNKYIMTWKQVIGRIYLSCD